MNKEQSFQIESFLSSNGLKTAWFATSSGLLRGNIGAKLDINYEKAFTIINCKFMSIENQPQIESFTVRLSEVYGWGLA